jgi:hypothetical protein
MYFIFQLGDLVKLHFTLSAIPRGKKNNGTVIARVDTHATVLLGGNMQYRHAMLPALDLGK